MSALIPLELLKFCNFNNKDVDKIVLDSVTIWEKTPCTILILGDNCAVSEEQFTVECSDSFVNSFPFYWSIIEGEQYVSINDSGLVTVNEDTPYSIVTIKATSSINSNLYATKTIRVQYAILSVDSSDPSFYTYIKGTPGSSGYNEGPENLFDGTTTTKWCMPDIGSGIYVIFGVETPLVLSGYSWAAGNDSTNGGRNPKSWKWYGSNADSSLLFLDNKWELLEDVVDNIKMLNTNYAWTSYTIDNPVRKKFKYFKLAISKKSSNTTGNYFQISELRVEGMVELIELLEEIKIIGPSEVENSALFEVEYLPSKTAYKDVIWEIVEGGDKVSISNTGKLNAKELVENFPVTIKVSSTYNSSIYDLKLVSVTSYVPSFIIDLIEDYPELNPEIIYSLYLEFPDIEYTLSKNSNILGWLISNSKAYINTGYIPNAYTNTIVDYYRKSTSDNFSYGCRVIHYSRAYLVSMTWNSNGNVGWNYGDGYSEKNGSSISIGKHIYETKEASLYIDNNLFLLRSISNFSLPPVNPFSIFAVCWSGSTMSYYDGQVSKFIIYDNTRSSLQFFFVPFLLSRDRSISECGNDMIHYAGEYGFIDLVSGKFFGDASGNKAFTYILE